MKILLLLAAPLALAAPAFADTYEPVNGAVSGRSPHTALRRVAQHRAACGSIRPSLPAGKLAPQPRQAEACTPELTARAGTVSGGAATGE